MIASISWPQSALNFFRNRTPEEASCMWMFLNINVLQGGLVSPSPNPQAGGPLLVGCPRLLIQFIRSYPPYWRPFLYPQPEDAPCRDAQSSKSTLQPMKDIAHTDHHAECDTDSHWIRAPAGPLPPNNIVNGYGLLSSYDDWFRMYVPGLPLYWDVLEVLHLKPKAKGAYRLRTFSRLLQLTADSAITRSNFKGSTQCMQPTHSYILYVDRSIA